MKQSKRHRNAKRQRRPVTPPRRHRRKNPVKMNELFPPGAILDATIGLALNILGLYAPIKPPQAPAAESKRIDPGNVVQLQKDPDGSFK